MPGHNWEGMIHLGELGFYQRRKKEGWAGKSYRVHGKLYLVTVKKVTGQNIILGKPLLYHWPKCVTSIRLPGPPWYYKLLESKGLLWISVLSSCPIGSSQQNLDSQKISASPHRSVTMESLLIRSHNQRKNIHLHESCIWMYKIQD